MNRRKTGDFWEEAAAQALQESGAEILARNYHCRGGEIDIVARFGDTVAFVEVKQRANDRFGAGAEAVNLRKQRRICKAALQYATQNDLLEAKLRFDVLEIGSGRMRHIPGAFEYSEVPE